MSDNTPNAVFQPITLLMPNPRDWEQALSKVQDPSIASEFTFRLSQTPKDVWRTFFYRAWKIWYESRTPPGIMGSLVVFECLPSQLSLYRGMIKAMIVEANQKAAPFVVDEKTRAYIRQNRDAKLYELERKHAHPTPLPYGRAGDELAAKLRWEQQNERTALLKEMAQTETRKAMEQMIEDELLEVELASNGLPVLR